MKKIFDSAVTHGGIFHGDEVMATAILRLLNPEMRVERKFRVEDKDTENPDIIMYDIGDGRYDHHSAECKKQNGCHAGTTIPYAACGLIWKDFGEEALKALDVPEEFISEVKAAVESRLIVGIDGPDNGVSVGRTLEVTFSQIVSSFNPTWEENDRTPDAAFEEAVLFAQMALKRVVASEKARADARAIVNSAVENMEGDIIILPKYVDWQKCVLNNERANNAMFVVYPSLRGGYNVQGVPAAVGSFETRCSMPESWRGLSVKDLEKVSGVKGLSFVHASGFLAAAKTVEAAVEAAKAAMLVK